MMQYRKRLSRQIIFPAVLACLIATAGSLEAQLDSRLDPAQDAKLKMSARYHIESGTDSGFLIVRLEVPAGSHIYSLTQPKPLKPSKLVVSQSATFVSDRIFKSDVKPTVVEHDPLFDCRIEKFSETVQFYVPIKVDINSDPNTLKPLIQYSGQLCSEQGYCILIDKLTAKAEFAGYFQREAKNAVPPLKIKK